MAVGQKARVLMAKNPPDNLGQSNSSKSSGHRRDNTGAAVTPKTSSMMSEPFVYGEQKQLKNLISARGVTQTSEVCWGELGEWIGHPGSKVGLVRFSIHLTDSKSNHGSCQALMDIGGTPEWYDQNSSYGPLDESPILGLRIRLNSALLKAYRLLLEATFVDGSSWGPRPAEEMCQASSLAPLEAFRLTLALNPAAVEASSGEASSDALEDISSDFAEPKFVSLANLEKGRAAIGLARFSEADRHPDLNDHAGDQSEREYRKEFPDLNDPGNRFVLDGYQFLIKAVITSGLSHADAVKIAWILFDAIIKQKSSESLSNPTDQVSRHETIKQERSIGEEAPATAKPVFAPILWSSDGRLPRESAVAFLGRVYKGYLGKNGLTRADLARLDKPLYDAIGKHISRHGNNLPFDLPSKMESVDRQLAAIGTDDSFERVKELERLAASMRRRLAKKAANQEK